MSRYISLIEHIWNYLIERISRRPPMNKLRDLENSLQREWNAIHQDTIQRYIRRSEHFVWLELRHVVAVHAVDLSLWPHVSFMCRWIKTNHWSWMLFSVVFWSLSVMHLLLFTTKTILVYVLFSKSKHLLVVRFQCIPAKISITLNLRSNLAFAMNVYYLIDPFNLLLLFLWLFRSCFSHPILMCNLTREIKCVDRRVEKCVRMIKCMCFLSLYVYII